MDDEIAHHLILGPAGEEARGEVGGPGPQLLYATIPDWGLKRQCHEIFWPFLLHELHPSKPLSNMQAKLVLRMDSFSPKYIWIPLLCVSQRGVFPHFSSIPRCVLQYTVQCGVLYFANIFAKTKLFAKKHSSLLIRDLGVGLIHEIKKCQKSCDTAPLIQYFGVFNRSEYCLHCLKKSPKKHLGGPHCPEKYSESPHTSRTCHDWSRRNEWTLEENFLISLRQYLLFRFKRVKRIFFFVK